MQNVSTLDKNIRIKLAVKGFETKSSFTMKNLIMLWKLPQWLNRLMKESRAEGPSLKQGQPFYPQRSSMGPGCHTLAPQVSHSRSRVRRILLWGGTEWWSWVSKDSREKYWEISRKLCIIRPILATFAALTPSFTNICGGRLSPSPPLVFTSAMKLNCIVVVD